MPTRSSRRSGRRSGRRAVPYLSSAAEAALQQDVQNAYYGVPQDQAPPSPQEIDLTHLAEPAPAPAAAPAVQLPVLPNPVSDDTVAAAEAKLAAEQKALEDAVETVTIVVNIDGSFNHLRLHSTRAMRVAIEQSGHYTELQPDESDSTIFPPPPGYWQDLDPIPPYPADLFSDSNSPTY